MAEYRYYLIPDAMTRAFPEQFGKQTPTEFFDNIADLEKRYHQLREMPYNNERTWNERTRFPYARLVVGIDRQNPDGAVAIIQVRNGVNYLCDDYRGPYADRSDAQIPQMAKKLVEVIGVDRVRPHTYTQRDGYTWVQVEKDRRHDRTRSGGRLCVKLPRKVCLCPAIFAARRAGQSKRGHQSGLFELCPILLLGAEPAFFRRQHSRLSERSRPSKYFPV